VAPGQCSGLQSCLSAFPQSHCGSIPSQLWLAWRRYQGTHRRTAAHALEPTGGLVLPQRVPLLAHSGSICQFQQPNSRVQASECAASHRTCRAAQSAALLHPIPPVGRATGQAGRQGWLQHTVGRQGMACRQAASHWRQQVGRCKADKQDRGVHRLLFTLLIDCGGASHLLNQHATRFRNTKTVQVHLPGPTTAGGAQRRA